MLLKRIVKVTILLFNSLPIWIILLFIIHNIYNYVPVRRVANKATFMDLFHRRFCSVDLAALGTWT